jgi:hypothetical protein
MSGSKALLKPFAFGAIGVLFASFAPIEPQAETRQAQTYAKSGNSTAIRPAGSENVAAPLKVLSLLAQRARLTAERNRSPEIVFPVGFEGLNPAANAVAESERRLFKARLAAQDNQKAQLSARIAQLEDEVRAFKSQHAAKRKEVTFLREELGMNEKLHKKQLINERRMLELKRDLARFEGEEGSLAANVERTKNQIEEVKLQVKAIDQQAAIDAERDLQLIQLELVAIAEHEHQAAFDAPNSGDAGGFRQMSAIAAPTYMPPKLSEEPQQPGPRKKALKRSAKGKSAHYRRASPNPLRQFARGVRRVLTFGSY